MSKQLDTLTETTPAPESLIRRLADSDNPNSFANRMRSRRFQLFEAAIASCARPVHILDVGGTNEYWERRGWAGRDDIQIVTLNIKADEQLREELKNWVVKEIGSIAKPDDIRFTDSLPKTRSGKIMRRLLKQIASGTEIKGDTTTLEDLGVLARLTQVEE